MMSKQKIEAGKDVDFATPDEVRTTMREALEEHDQRKATGPLIVHMPTARMSLSPGMSATLTDSDGNEIAPASGRIWSIRRVSVHAGAPVDLHISDATPSTYIATVHGTREFGKGSLLTRTGQSLSVRNATQVSAILIVNLALLDIPADQEWRLFE